MKIKLNKLVVIYNSDKRLHKSLEKTLKQVIKETTDLHFSGSGYDVLTGDRDLVFRKFKKEEKK